MLPSLSVLSMGRAKSVRGMKAARGPTNPGAQDTGPLGGRRSPPGGPEPAENLSWESPNPFS